MAEKSKKPLPMPTRAPKAQIVKNAPSEGATRYGMGGAKKGKK